MSVRLLDVNLPISLFDQSHVHHAPVVSWFDRVASRSGWATCPIAENGLIRIISGVAYPNVRLSPASVAGLLAQFESGLGSSYQFHRLAGCAWGDSEPR